ncbi:MAG: hypothetical protein HC892_16425 [Saprospiraceae bacterium]|nr:hypothetical protein [Saprospiraceae bacterium]
MKQRTTTNSKNVIADSNISVGGNFNQGDGKQDNRSTTININIGRIAIGGGITIGALAVSTYLLFPNIFVAEEKKAPIETVVVDSTARQPNLEKKPVTPSKEMDKPKGTSPNSTVLPTKQLTDLWILAKTQKWHFLILIN